MLDWRQENNLWYCYKNNQRIKGWVQDDDKKWYHLNESTYQLDTGWIQDGNFWYYLYPKRTESNGITHVTGEMATGWIQLNSAWYYLVPQKTVNYGIEYPTGAMIVDWCQIDGKWYYFLKEKTEYNSNTHYKGEMVSNVTLTLSGKEYSFNADGSLNDSTGLSDKGAEFIASWEGFSSTWEDVGDGYWTIGIGTATSGTLGKQLYDSGIKSCTREQAYKWLEQECSSCYEAIKSILDESNIVLSVNAIDALISMAYNIGQVGLINSTLFKNILNGVTDESIIRQGFEAYSYCNGKVWEGLKKRRDSEANLYLYADYTGNN
jgi:lysozyme